MAKYDPTIIEKMATRLYRRANTTIFVWIIAGAIGGAIVGYAGWPALAWRLDVDAATAQDSLKLVAICMAVACGLIGFLIGTERAFMIKLDAQKLLCMLQTEINTRS